MTGRTELPDVTRLDGRVALVTGAARGIGLATARRLAAAGAAVVLADVDADELDRAARTIDGAHETVAGDLTAPGVGEALAAATVRCFGPLDVVVNNAGYNWNAPLAETTDDQLDAMVGIHLGAPLRILRAAAAQLTRPGAAHVRKVVNVSSVSGTMGNAEQTAYAASKAALVGLTKTLAKEWGPLGVTVNAIAPGFVDTRLTAERDVAGFAHAGGRSVELGVAAGRREQVTQLIALRRTGSPDDVARVALFLSSPASDYVTGQVVNVNGGLMLGMSC